MNNSIPIITIVALLVFLAVMFLITLYLYRRLSGQGAGGIGDGDAGKSLAEFRKELKSRDEIGDLIKSFDSMESALLTQMENIAIMTAEREKARAELDVATHIQMDALPDNFEEVSKRSGCDIYGSMKPAKEVGGDFYDFFMPADDKLCIVIADVSGKGVPGALFMMISKVLLKQRAMAGGSPSEILYDVNNQLCADNKEMLFVTAWVGILDLVTGDVSYCNAGHENAVLLSHGGGTLSGEAVNDPPLALAEGFTFEEKRLHLDHGDGLFVYTDGVAEAKGTDDARYGLERMVRVLEGCGDEASCKEVIGTMERDMDVFVDNKEPFDDVTMLMIRRGKGEDKRD